MKYSAAILKGFKAVDGRQCKNELARDERGRPAQGATHPHSVCVQGAALLATVGRADWDYGPADNLVDGASDRFETVWGIHPVDLNNGGMPWEHIYGMAKAVGL